MATHPYAMKCEKVLAELIRLRDAMQKAKDAGLDMPNPRTAKRKPTKIFTHRQLGSIGGSGSAPAAVEFSHAGIAKRMSKREWTQFRRLQAKLAMAEKECLERFLLSQSVTPTFDEDGNPTGARREGGSKAPCPKARQIEKQIRAMFPAEQKAKAESTSGGGGGGGF
jgi:hypothetical protein